jgi:hypothetical protein
MTTDQEARGTAHEPVTLECALERRDFAEAMAAWRRARRLGFAGRPLFVVPLAVLVLALVGLKIAEGEMPGLALWMSVFGLLAVVAGPLISTAAVAKANGHHGVMRAVLDDAGIAVHGTHMQTTTAWTNYGSYQEARTLFLLRSPEKAGRCIVILPKRALADEAEVSRLRALLASHLREVR